MKRADIPVWRRLLITPDEMAALAGLTTKTIRDYCNQGKIPCFKIGNAVKIPVKKAEEALEILAMNREGFAERHRADELKGDKPKRRRTAL